MGHVIINFGKQKNSLLYIKFPKLSFKVDSWPWKQQLIKQSHLRVHFVATPELSVVYDLIFISRWNSLSVRDLQIF